MNFWDSRRLTVRVQPTVPGWARMHCEGGAVMFLLAEHPANASAQAVPLVLYTPDLPALREHLLANGIDAPPINYPEYMPSGEITIRTLTATRSVSITGPRQCTRNGLRISSGKGSPDCCRL